MNMTKQNISRKYWIRYYPHANDVFPSVQRCKYEDSGG